MPLIINLPPEGTTIGNNSSENDFILFLQGLTLTTYDGYSGPGKPYTGIAHKCKFAIWDNRLGNIVKYGKTEGARNKFGYNTTKDTWEKSLSNLIKNILKDSPFYREKTYGY